MIHTITIAVAFATAFWSAPEEEVKAHTEYHYLVRELNISKACNNVEQIAPMFRNLSGMKNVYLPEKFTLGLRNQ